MKEAIFNDLGAHFQSRDPLVCSLPDSLGKSGHLAALAYLPLEFGKYLSGRFKNAAKQSALQK
jgi:hypothetical protein